MQSKRAKQQYLQTIDGSIDVAALSKLVTQPQPTAQRAPFEFGGQAEVVDGVGVITDTTEEFACTSLTNGVDT